MLFPFESQSILHRRFDPAPFACAADPLGFHRAGAARGCVVPVVNALDAFWMARSSSRMALSCSFAGRIVFRPSNTARTSSVLMMIGFILPPPQNRQHNYGYMS